MDPTEQKAKMEVNEDSGSNANENAEVNIVKKPCKEDVIEPKAEVEAKEDDLYLITENKNYIIQKGSFMKLVKAKRQKLCQLGRSTLDLACLLAHPVGSQFRLQPVPGKRMMHAELVEKAEDLVDHIAAEESVPDNRHLVGSTSSQALTRQNIVQMRESGVTGRQIVSSIVDNSASFQGKTEYSQEKYVRKKQKKYFEFISVHEPTARLVASMYYMHDPLKIMNLRVDTLSQLLTAANVRAGGRYLLLETGCLGVTVSALLERLGGHGRLVHLYQGGNPQRQAVDAINFSSAQLSCLTCLDLRSLLARFPPKSHTTAAAVGANGDAPARAQNGAASEGGERSDPDAATAEPAVTSPPPAEPAAADPAAEESAAAEQAAETTQDGGEGGSAARKRRRSGEDGGNEPKKSKYGRTRSEDVSLSLEMMQSRDMDGLVVCCRQHPLNLLVYLTDFLADSRSFAVFCPYKEPLLECYFAMKAKGYIMLKVTETWLRDYQVLPERTHPGINMSGGGGYLLTGIKVTRPISQPPGQH